MIILILSFIIPNDISINFWFLFSKKASFVCKRAVFFSPPLSFLLSEITTFFNSLNFFFNYDMINTSIMMMQSPRHYFPLFTFVSVWDNIVFIYLVLSIYSSHKLLWIFLESYWMLNI